MLIGYARVSTEEQTDALQIDALKEAGCERIFQETASGGDRNRPQLRAALDYVRRGDVLTIWRYDRLARSLSHLISVVEELKRREIGFKSLTDDVDTTKANGMLLLQFYGGLAEFELNRDRERTMAGLAIARKEGRTGGRPVSMSKDDITAARALMLDRSISMKAIAARVGVSVATLYNHFPGGRSVILEANETT